MKQNGHLFLAESYRFLHRISHKGCEIFINFNNNFDYNLKMKCVAFLQI